MGNPYYAKFRKPLSYWGAWSTEQAAYYLYTFHKVDPKLAAPVVEYLCQSGYLHHIQGRTDIVGLQEMPGDIFTKNREMCVWKFFDTMSEIIKATGNAQARPELIARNAFNGVDYVYNDEYYSLVYISPTDGTYYNVLNQKYDESAIIIYVTDRKTASTIKKAHPEHDLIYCAEKIGNRVDFDLYEGD